MAGEAARANGSGAAEDLRARSDRHSAALVDRSSRSFAAFARLCRPGAGTRAA